MTSPQKKFIALCKIIDIKYQRQYCVLGKFYDFYLEDYNALIQIDGKYWHGKNLKFQQKNMMQKKNASNDIYKNRLAKRMNYKLYRIWEDQLTQKKVRQIIQELKNDKR